MFVSTYIRSRATDRHSIWAGAVGRSDHRQLLSFSRLLDKQRRKCSKLTKLIDQSIFLILQTNNSTTGLNKMTLKSLIFLTFLATTSHGLIHDGKSRFKIDSIAILMSSSVLDLPQCWLNVVLLYVVDVLHKAPQSVFLHALFLIVVVYFCIGGHNVNHATSCRIHRRKDRDLYIIFFLTVIRS